MFLIIKRTFRESVKSILRNGWLSIATISILIMSLYVISVFYVFTYTADGMLKEIKNKANISVYFKSDVSEDVIQRAQSEIANVAGVKAVNYVSKEMALETFKKNNASEPVIMDSLKEIGENPLLASLVIKANDPSEYLSIAESIRTSEFSDDISRINYNKNKELIDKLNSVVTNIQKIGLSLGILLASISLLITFNAIRITIYSHKQEIEIMRLVGASNMFIRLPFIFEGIIYGVVGSLISILILFISLKFMVPYITSAIPVESLIEVYKKNFWLILGYQVFLGSFFGVVGGIMAMRKYLKV